MNYSNKASKTRRHSNGRQLAYQNLEPRNLLAGISFDQVTGTIFIEGTQDRDFSEVSDSGNQLEVRLSGFDVQTFNVDEVNLIEFRGLDGDDAFENFSTIPSVAYGNGGNDVLTGGSEKDILFGGNGNDRLWASFRVTNTAFDFSENEIYGGAGDDEIQGSGGDDLIFGGFGDDEIFGFQGDDEIRGGDGNDFIRGNRDNDRIFGGDGNDTIFGNHGENLIFGGLGADVITSHRTNTLQSTDRIVGGDGDDEIISRGDNEEIFGGVGNDTIRIEGEDTTAYGGDDNDEIRVAEDRFLRGLTLFGGTGDDILSGGRAGETFFGGAGNDQIFAQGSLDTIFGGSGNDVITGGGGADRIFGGNGNDLIWGDSNGASTFDDGSDEIFGGAGDDIIRGEGRDDVIAGEAGNDTIFGLEGDDELYGGEGDDLLLGNQGLDILAGQAGNDEVRGGLDADRISGGSGDDVLRGEAGADVLLGGDGNDQLFGLNDDDVLRGGAGIDGLSGGNGRDQLFGGADSDRFLTQIDEVIEDFATEDAQIQLRNSSVLFNAQRIEAIDNGLRTLHLRTGNNALLTDSLSDNPIVITLVDSQAGSLQFVTNNFNSVTDTRNITIQAFDESLQTTRDFVAAETTRAFALNLAGNLEIQSKAPLQSDYFTRFRALSGWTADPGSFEEFSVSGDGTEFYLNDADFVPEELATFNSRQDFASTWAAVLDPNVSTQDFSAKALSINTLLDLLGT